MWKRFYFCGVEGLKNLEFCSFMTEGKTFLLYCFYKYKKNKNYKYYDIYIISLTHILYEV